MTNLRTPLGERITDLKAVLKHFIEFVDVIEVVSLVLAGLLHDPQVDHVVDDVTKAACTINAPVVQHDFCHVTELV